MDSAARQQPQVQPCRYKVGKTLGAGSYSVVKECVHIDTGRYYAAKVINKRLMAGREHMVRITLLSPEITGTFLYSVVLF
jgi:calcium/calmodulin-dependent protein kinase I